MIRRDGIKKMFCYSGISTGINTFLKSPLTSFHTKNGNFTSFMNCMNVQMWKTSFTIKHYTCACACVCVCSLFVTHTMKPMMTYVLHHTDMTQFHSCLHTHTRARARTHNNAVNHRHTGPEEFLPAVVENAAVK